MNGTMIKQTTVNDFLAGLESGRAVHETRETAAVRLIIRASGGGEPDHAAVRDLVRAVADCAGVSSGRLMRRSVRRLAAMVRRYGVRLSMCRDENE